MLEVVWCLMLELLVVAIELILLGKEELAILIVGEGVLVLEKEEKVGLFDRVCVVDVLFMVFVGFDVCFVHFLSCACARIWRVGGEVTIYTCW